MLDDAAEIIPTDSQGNIIIERHPVVIGPRFVRQRMKQGFAQLVRLVAWQLVDRYSPIFFGACFDPLGQYAEVASWRVILASVVTPVRAVDPLNEGL